MKTPTTEIVHNRHKLVSQKNRFKVHLRIALDKAKTYVLIPTPLMVSPEEWSGTEGRWVNEMHPYAFEINDKIRQTRNKVEEVVKRFYMHGKQIAMSDIVYHIGKKGDNQIFNDFVREFIRLKPETLSIATWEKYTTFCNHLDAFNPKIPFMNVNPSLVASFKKHLEDQGFLGSTMKVYFDKFKKVVKYAEKENYIDQNQTRFLFDNATIKVNKAKRIYLEVEEIKLLRLAHFPADEMARERNRDIFLFQLYTGSYYNDLKIMRKDQLIKDPEYGNFIIGERDKNGNDRIIPLYKFPYAQAILDKYRDPNPSNQLMFKGDIFVNDHVYNRTLKRIAKSLGIEKEITGKVARHTYAQLWIRYGANRPVVSKMLGHTKEETTNHYYSINIPEVIEGTKGVDFAALGI